MEKLIAFHGRQSAKDKYLKRVLAHAKADQIVKGQFVKGQYWENGKGCAVGCTIHGSNHDAYETELGIPWQIAYLEDTLFEELPNDLAMTFPVRFLESITPGADLSLVVAKLMVWQFEDEKYGIKHGEEIKKDKELMDMCTEVVSAYKRVLNGEVVSEKEWNDLADKADKMYGFGIGIWVWVWVELEAGARAWAEVRAWARAEIRAWARAWDGADYEALYEEAIVATSEKFLELLREAK